MKQCPNKLALEYCLNFSEHLCDEQIHSNSNTSQNATNLQVTTPNVSKTHNSRKHFSDKENTNNEDQKI